MDAHTLVHLCYREGWTPRLRDQTYWYAHRTATGKPQSVYLCTQKQVPTLDEATLLGKLHSKGPGRQAPALHIEWLPGGVLRLKKAGRAINVDAHDQAALRAALTEKGDI